MKDPVLKKKLLSLQDELEHIDEYIVSEDHDGDAKDAPSKPSQKINPLYTRKMNEIIEFIEDNSQ